MLRGIRILSLVFVLLFPVLILAQTGSISGNVTDEATSLPLPGVHLAAIAGSGPHPHMTLGIGVTDSNGDYTIHNLPAAVDYFVAACRMGYQCEFYDNATTISAATLIPVTDSVTTSGIDFARSGDTVCDRDKRSSRNSGGIVIELTLIAHSAGCHKVVHCRR